MRRRCERLQLVLIHAQNDGTMPWDQTEELFKTTLRAATEEVGPKFRVVDLGEAGKQEVWRQGPRSISKLIAKHGGEFNCSWIILGWSHAYSRLLQITIR